MPHHHESLLFLVLQSTTESRLVHPLEPTVLLSEPFTFPMKPSDIAFTAMLIYKLSISFGTITTVMHTANCLLNTGAGVNLIHFSMVSRERTHHTKRDCPQTLCTAKKKTFAIEIDPSTFLGYLYTRMWFGVGPHLLVDIFLATSFIDHFIREILLSGRKLAP